MSEPRAKSAFNPWPYSILGFFAVAIVAAVVWVVFCIGHGNDLVAADYYEQEVEYQRQIDRIERTRSLAGDASILYHAGMDRVEIRLPAVHATASPEGVIHFYRPDEAGLDETVRLEVDMEGVQQVDASRLKAGLWDVRVHWRIGGTEFFISDRLTIVPQSS